MNLKNLPLGRIITFCVLATAIAYAAFYFNYFETPSGDYIGNIREPVLDYMKGNFPGQNYKFLPLYPLILSLLTRLNTMNVFDRIYMTAIILNFFLFVPYIIIVFQIYRRFLGDKTALLALVFLGVNIYTVYTAVNSELEMLLSLLAVLSIYLTLRDSRMSYVTAFLAAVTKWDSVFIIPAVMFRDFFYRKEKLTSVLLGIAAASGISAWLVLSVVDTSGHQYVSEIAHRGPNIYRFIIDCFLVNAGFIQWMATHGYFHENPVMKTLIFVFLIIPAIAVVGSTVSGIIRIIREKKHDIAPLLIFFSGFLLIHVIYQNTKDRYVLPILWILNLFMFYGFTEVCMPAIKNIYGKFSLRGRTILVAVSLAAVIILFVTTLAAVFIENTPAHVLFASVFGLTAAAIILYGSPRKNILTLLIGILAFGTIVNLMVFYGVRTMDHHSLSRVEFKKAALWYSEHAAASDRMLISETNVPKYYSGFGEHKFIISYLIRGNTIEELVPELREKKATYVFVDDFYIRRLAYGDPNAIDRKAWIFKEVRDKGEKTGHFKLVEKFHTRGGITSYLYRFIP